MDIKLLRSFATLAEHGTYHAAAAVLCVTQPALTKQIQALEHEIGMTLFQRGRHGAKLTVTGSLLYTRTRQLLKYYDEFLGFTYRVQKGSTGKLVLGFGISSFQIAPAWLNIFREQFPDVEVLLNDIPSSVQCQMLLDGQLQAGFVRLPLSEELKAKVVVEERLDLAVPSTLRVDPDNIQSVLEKYQLLQINPERGRGLAYQAACFLKENNFTVRPASAADDIHTLLALIAAGNGISLLPAGVSHFLPAGVMLVVLEGKYTRWQVGIAWNPKIQDGLRDKFLQIVSQNRR